MNVAVVEVDTSTAQRCAVKVIVRVVSTSAAQHCAVNVVVGVEVVNIAYTGQPREYVGCC